MAGDFGVAWRVAAVRDGRAMDDGDVADQANKVAAERAARWGRAVAVVLGTALAVSTSACTWGGSTQFTPKPVETITPSAPQKPSASPTKTPSATPTSAAPTPDPVDATGTMAIFLTVSDALKGTCQTGDGAPTIKLADHANEWYGTVDLTVVLDAARKKVASVDGAFGKDSEGFTWKLGYNAAKPAKGTSGKLATSGNTFTVSGKLLARETRKGTTRTEVLPYKITAKCRDSKW